MTTIPMMRLSRFPRQVVELNQFAHLPWPHTEALPVIALWSLPITLVYLMRSALRRKPVPSVVNVVALRQLSWIQVRSDAMRLYHRNALCGMVVSLNRRAYHVHVDIIAISHHHVNHLRALAVAGIDVAIEVVSSLK